MATAQNPTGIRTLFPEEVKTFIHDHNEGEYILLDVRQPFEYEEAHLPGATLIPLPQLADSLQTLDQEKPTIVYCAVGGRSRMATQLLMSLGFKNVFNLTGGIQAWENRTATGPVELHLDLIRGDESPEEIIRLTYRFEEGLKIFHENFRSKTDDPELINLLDGLIKAEESHEKTLLTLWESLAPESRASAPGSNDFSDIKTRLMEGGIDIDDFMRENLPFLCDVRGYLDISMMIETQAFDLYLRMAKSSQNEVTQSILHSIGNEEKAHLQLLGKYLDGLS
jgi:sulfur-carrier protein adenylyltransferase/sulfurtransferase